MKNIILMAGLLLCGITQAQITVTGRNNQPITEGYEYVTHTLTPLSITELPLHVTNISGNTMNLKLKVTSMTNTTGQNNIQFCFGGLCYFNITLGKTVPNTPVSGLTLAADASNANGDHFYLGSAGTNPSEDVVVGLAFIEVDGAGTQIGDPLLNFTYRYAPTAGVSEFNALRNMGISLKSTVVSDALDMEASQNAKLEIFNTTGQMVKVAEIKTGTQSTDISGLSAGVYIARFTNEENKSSQIRIVKN